MQVILNPEAWPCNDKRGGHVRDVGAWFFRSFHTMREDGAGWCSRRQCYFSLASSKSHDLL